MSLINCKREFDNRIKIIDSCFEQEALSTLRRRAVSKKNHNEGLISFLWQSWCHFCRDVIYLSITNGVTKNGVITTSQYAHLDKRQIITLARLFGSGKPCPNNIQFSNEWNDITWGDAAKLNGIIGGFAPVNKNTLLSSFGILQHVKSLQICRNSCAHISSYTVGEVKLLRVNYSNTILRHPSDMMFWVNPNTNDYLWKTWVDEMLLVSEFAIE